MEAEDKQQHILEKTRLLFMSYGIRSLSMDDVSRHLAISKKTLYQYFSSKDDLVEKVIRQILENSELIRCSESWQNLNAIDILLKASQIVNEEIKQSNPVVVFDLQKYYPELYADFIEKKKQHIYSRITENMEQGISEGFYRSDLNIELVARLYVNNLVELHRADFVINRELTFAEVFQVMFENHIRAISNQEGVKYFEEKKSSLNLNTNLKINE
jgi:AcrR family transcriptional regulator